MSQTIPLAKMTWFQQGGAAFPIPHSGAPGQPEAEHGMTLRDWFAGQALPQACETTRALLGRLDSQSAAERAYTIADAMLDARAKATGQS